MIRLHVAQYYQAWKIEEEVTAQGHYITLPGAHGNMAEALVAARKIAEQYATKYHEETKVTTISKNRVQ